MGRSIAGALVGMLVYGVTSLALSLAFFFILKRDGILDPNTGQLTIVYVILSLALGAGAGYLSGAVGRAVGKGKASILMIAVVAIIANGIMLAGRNKPTELPDGFSPTGIQKDSLDIQEAAKTAPIWFPLTQLLLGIGGLALGGLEKSDFGSRTGSTEQPGT